MEIFEIFFFVEYSLKIYLDSITINLTDIKK